MNLPEVAAEALLLIRLARELVTRLGDTALAWDLAARAAAVEGRLLALEEEALL